MEIHLPLLLDKKFPWPCFDGVFESERVAAQVMQIREREAIPRIHPVREQDIAI